MQTIDQKPTLTKEISTSDTLDWVAFPVFT